MGSSAVSVFQHRCGAFIFRRLESGDCGSIVGSRATPHQLGRGGTRRRSLIAFSISSKSRGSQPE